MLRINLLPSYVGQRKLTRKIILGGSILLILCLAIPLYLWHQAVVDKDHWTDLATTAEAGKKITDDRKSQAAATRAKIAPLLAKVKYVQDVHQHNNDIVNFWNTVAQYSDPKVVYSDAAVSGSTLTLKAYTPNIAEIGRYLQAMYSEPDFTSVGIDRLPGYPEAVVNKYYLNNKLLAVDSAPSQSSGGGGSGFGGGQNSSFGSNSTASAGRWPYGGTGPIGSGAGVPVIGTANGNNGPGGQAGGNSQNQGNTQKLAQVLMSDQQFKSVALNPFAPPASQFQAILNLIKKIKVRREPQGFPVTITATLRQPLLVPSVPGTAAAAPGIGGPGGMPGMPGPGAGMPPSPYPGGGSYPGAQGR
jgi:hypothetical protein